MPGFNTVPASGGGGGQPNMTFIGSIHMTTYNRSWAQGGTAGYYGMFSVNQEAGYAYFVGSTTTGIPLNRLAYVSHSFTRVDIIAPQNDMMSLYKAKVKSTTEFPNPFASFPSFPTNITTSGNFILPDSALPLVNVLLAGAGGAGGHGNHHHGGGGGAGGAVVKLTAFSSPGITGVQIGSGAGGENQAKGGDTYFGNVYALGGGGGGHGGGNAGGSGGNGGGGAGAPGGAGIVQTSSTGLGFTGSPVYVGGHNGGYGNGNNHHHRTGGGGGAGGVGGDGTYNDGGHGGAGHVSDIIGSNHGYGAGGWGSAYNNHSNHGAHRDYAHGGNGGREGNGNRGGGANGVVVVRYYIPS